MSILCFDVDILPLRWGQFGVQRRISVMYLSLMPYLHPLLSQEVVKGLPWQFKLQGPPDVGPPLGRGWARWPLWSLPTLQCHDAVIL